MKNKDLRKNASGCPDPTAYQAIKKIDKEDARFKKLLKSIFSICELAGYEVYGRITLVDKASGKVWK